MGPTARSPSARLFASRALRAYNCTSAPSFPYLRICPGAPYSSGRAQSARPIGSRTGRTAPDRCCLPRSYSHIIARRCRSALICPWVTARNAVRSGFVPPIRLYPQCRALGLRAVGGGRGRLSGGGSERGRAERAGRAVGWQLMSGRVAVEVGNRVAVANEAEPSERVGRSGGGSWAVGWRCVCCSSLPDFLLYAVKLCFFCYLLYIFLYICN